MGNTQGKDTFKNKMLQTISEIEKEYLLKTQFNELRDLRNEEKCNNLVILTSEVFDKNFNSTELTWLKQHQMKGLNGEVQIIDKKVTDPNLRFITRQTLTQVNTPGDKKSLSKVERTRICNSIAKYYVKILHVFSAIAAVVGYDSSTGKDVEKMLRFSDDFRKMTNLSRNPLQNKDFCSKRMELLLGRTLSQESLNSKDKKKTIQPILCDSQSGRTIKDVYGINQLDKLYQSEYDYNKRAYKLSDKSKKQKQEDLKLFYKVFIGNDYNEKENGFLKSFGQIALIDLSRHPFCKSNKWRESISETDINSQLIGEYAENLRAMINEIGKYN